MTGDGQQQGQALPSSMARLDRAIARCGSVMKEREPALSVGRERATHARRAAQMTRQRLRGSSAAMQAVERRARLMVRLTRTQINNMLLISGLRLRVIKLLIYVGVYRNKIVLGIAAFLLYYYWSDVILAIESFKILLEQRLELLLQ